MAKLGTWLIVVGALFAVFGLTVLPAALTAGEDKTLLNISVLAISSAMTTIAAGLYLKARAFPSAATGEAGNAPKRARKANCDSCGKQEPAIQCRVHQLHLCGDCLAKHYDFRSCAYIPSTRRGARPSTYAQASGA